MPFNSTINQTEIDHLCCVLRSFVEEWGPDQVVVAVPHHWKDLGVKSFGRVCLEFSTERSIAIVVEHEGGRLTHEASL